LNRVVIANYTEQVHKLLIGNQLITLRCVKSQNLFWRSCAGANPTWTFRPKFPQFCAQL